MNKLLACDTPYLCFRSYFGVPRSFINSDGHPVNAVRGICATLTALVEKYSPDRVLCAWDEDWRPAWRVALMPSYKAHRAAGEGEEMEEDLARQLPWIREVLAAVGLPVVGVADYEADDVLGSAVSCHDGESLVVTGDRDLFQLVNKTTRVVYLVRSVANHDLVDLDWLARKFGIPAGRYVDFAVLRGDPSDGLPGVKGIGERTAARLVADYPSLSAMLAAAADSSSGLKPGIRRNLLAAADYLESARRVVVTTNTLRLPDVKGVLDEAAVERLTKELSLGNTLTKLAAALATRT